METYVRKTLQYVSRGEKKLKKKIDVCVESLQSFGFGVYA